MAPYNGTSDEMKAVGKHLRDNGLYTFVRWNTIMTNPPLTITEERAGGRLRDHRRAPSTSPTRASAPDGGAHFDRPSRRGAPSP